MRRVLPGLVLALALAIALGALLSAPEAPASSTTMRASAVNYALNYSDPSSDVFKLYTSNGTHVTDAAGYWIMSPSPGTVNLLRLSSADAGASVSVYLKVQTSISVAANTTYEWRLYTRADNATHYILTFRDGLTSLVSNHTGSATVNLTSSTQVGTLGWLGVSVSKADLGGSANITAWNIDATAKEIAGNYTYEDFGWSQPGNPGSAPAFIQGRVTDAATGAGLANVNVSTGSGGYYAFTNATGYYSLPAAPGNFTLTFSLSGYDPGSKTVSVNYQQTQTVNEQLTKTTAFPLGTLSVLVLLLVVVAGVAAFLVFRSRKSRRKENPPQGPAAP